MRDETSVRHHRRWCRSALVKSPGWGYGDELSKGAHIREVKGYDRGDVPGKRGQQTTLRLIIRYAGDQLQGKDILTSNLQRNLFL